MSQCFDNQNKSICTCTNQMNDVYLFFEGIHQENRAFKIQKVTISKNSQQFRVITKMI